MAETKNRPLIRDISEAEINEKFRAGKLSHKDRDYLLRLKAHETIFGDLEEKGFIPAVYNSFLKKFGEGWEDFKEGASNADLPAWKNMLLTVWGQWQMITSVTDALGEVSGHQMERAALAVGLSPGAARFINMATELGVNIAPTGFLVKSLAKTAQKVGTAVAASAKATKEAEKKVAEQELVKLEEAVVKGLEVDGVKPPAGVVAAPTTTSTTAIATNIPPFKLPKDLAGAQINFNIGKDAYTLRFQDDLDRALVILAQEKPSRRDADYLKAVMDHLKMPEDEVRSLAQDVKLGVKMDLVGMPFGVHDIRPMAKDYLTGVRVRPDAVEAATRVVKPKPAFKEARDTASVPKLRIPKAKNPERIADQAKAEATKVAKENPTAVKRELQAFKDRTNIDPTELALDRNWTEAQMLAYVRVVQPHIDEIGDLAKMAATSGEPADLWAFGRYMTTFFTKNHTTGQSTADVSAEFRKLLMHWDPSSMANGDIQGALKTMAQDITSLTIRPVQGGAAPLTWFAINMNRMFGRYGSDVWPVIREIYANLLLPFAWAPTFVGNSLTMGTAVLERAAGAAFGTGGTINKEAYYMAKGMMLATGDGLKAAGRAYTTMGTQAGRLGYNQAIPGPIGAIVRGPGNTVRGVDELFSTMFVRGALYARYIREADQLGLKGQAAGQYVVRQFNGPPTIEALREARKLAEESTFQNQLGRFGHAMSQATVNSPLFFYFPFLKSGINLAKYTWARTPGLQLMSRQLYKDLAAGGPVADAAIGRLVISNLTAGLLFDLAREGYITGSGPRNDPTLYKSWAANNQPYSARTPTGWVQLQSTEPGSTIAGLIADFATVAPYLEETDFQQLAQAVVYPIVKNLGDTTWLRNSADLVDVIQNLRANDLLSDRNLEYLRSPFVNILTGGPMTNRIRQIVDPELRETRGMLDEVMNRIPGYSKTLPPVPDGYGDPVIPPFNNWWGLLKPIVPSFKPFEKDPAKIEGDRVQARLPVFGDRIGGKVTPEGSTRQIFVEEEKGVKLTPQEWQRRVKIYNDLVKDKETGIQTLIDSKDYKFQEDGKPQPKAYKREVFTGHMRELWKASGQLLIEESPQLQNKLIQNLTISSGALTAGEDPTGPQVPTDPAFEPDGTEEEIDNLRRLGSPVPDR